MRLSFLGPPYRQLTSLLPGQALTRGSIVLLTEESNEPARLFNSLEAVQGFAMAVVVVATMESSLLPAGVIEELAAQGIDALIPSLEGLDAQAVVEAARAANEPSATRIAARLRLFGRPVAPQVESALAVLLEGTDNWHVREWAEALGVSSRTLERRFERDWGGPKPRRWIDLVRTLQAAAALQRADDGRSVESILGTLGFMHAKSYRRLFDSVAGATPGEVRRLIGWHWITLRWANLFWPAAEAGETSSG